ncbi:hypothetical protein SAMN05421505_1373 [Sinosporangium album]|uniref:Uncharacterized protein n=1 Tax=Sinosporangium album TaxID=504805 RepID=A0A1G8IFE8_9ACTN|nr:hypothetical protein SAMN05421505_1373 [Sinosporangium album]
MNRRESEHQYIHLMRVAWELRTMACVAVELAERETPVLLVRCREGHLRGRAYARGRDWYLAWGRSKFQRIKAFDENPPKRTWQAAQC